MKKIHTIVAGEKYGKYTAIETRVAVLKTGTKVWKWLCTDETGNEVLRPKCVLLDQLTEKELNQRFELHAQQDILNNTYQLGIRHRFFDEYRRNSAMKKHDFYIDFEYFNKLISSNCHYCGKEPVERDRWKQNEHKGQQRLKCNGIDRIDSKVGYTTSNTVACCSMCNIMKNVYSQKDFLEHASRIHQFNNKSSTTRVETRTSQVNGDGNGDSPTVYIEENDIV
jgi:hypothetical protein